MNTVTSPSSFLSVHELTAGYSKTPVIHGISLQVMRGEIVTIIGANGAGKTTTLAAISRILPTHGGTIRFDDEDLSTCSAASVVRRGLVHVPEGRKIFSRLTVSENLALGAYIKDDAKQVAQNRERVLTLFPRLKERLAQFGGTLSGGEQQMLAIARGLMSNPRMLLLDEPSMGIAPVLVELIFKTIKQLQSEGMTILLVEQNALQALTIADRAYVLETGKVTLAGEAAKIKDDAAVQRAYLGG